MALLWLSFVDPEKPQGERSLGVIITEASDVVDAAGKLHDLGINPGGEVACWPVNEEHRKILAPHMNKLMSADEINQLKPANTEDD
jgi:hypothetical protein